MNLREPFALGDWTFDPATGTLAGPAGNRRLTPKLADLLVVLARHASQVVTRDDLLREVWGERSAVADEPLTRAIAELRRALGDERADPAYIETIPKRGYRLIAAVAPVKSAHAAAPPPAAAPEPAARLARAGAAWPESRWRLIAIGLAATAMLTLVAVTLIVRMAPPARPAGALSVAVLPFADSSPGADRQYFADGVHEEIIARLTAIPALQVATRSAVESYRDQSVETVARALGVDAVLEGSVRYADDRVRVSAQLTDATTARNLWAETFDRPLSLASLFDIQADIADGVAAGLRRSLALQNEARAAALPTQRLEAYESFLLGKYHYRRRQPGDLEQALEQFQSAVDLDPRFAQAWDWLSYCWLEAGTDLPWATPDQAFPRARAAALRALELDAGLATSAALLGFLRATYDRDWAGGLVELERAAAAAPLETGTVWSYAFVLSLVGRHDEALAAVTRLANEVPDDARLQLEVAERAVHAGRFDLAIERANAALKAGAEPGQVRETLGAAAFGAGELAAAIAELEQAVELQHEAVGTTSRLAAAYARAGRPDDARRLLTDLEQRVGGSPLHVATLARVHLALGDAERALALLARGVEQRQRDTLDIGIDPFFAAARDDPRFVALIERMGLPPPARGRDER